VLVSARKFADLKTAPSGVEIVNLKPVERTVRLTLHENGNGSGNDRIGIESQDMLPGLGGSDLDRG
jgi:hypothetical protein